MRCFVQVNFVDNQDVLDLIEKKPSGILIVLDDQIKVKNGTDATFYNKVSESNSAHPKFKQMRSGVMLFGTIHGRGGLGSSSEVGLALRIASDGTCFVDWLMS